MPRVPRMNCGKKVRLKPTNTSRQADPAPELAVHPAGHLRPPVVQPGQEGDQRAADHDVMEMGHDEVGVVHVDVDRQGAEEQARSGRRWRTGTGTPGRSTSAWPARSSPCTCVASQLKTLMAEGMATANVRALKIMADQRRLAADEHVVAPDQEADQGDGDAAVGDEAVAEDVLAAEDGDRPRS